MKLNNHIFDAFPVLKTERLTLRDIRISDADKIFELRTSGTVNQFIARNTMNSIGDSEQFIEEAIHAYHNKKAISWTGIFAENNEIIGTCGFQQIDFQNRRAEIVGELSAKYWGKNISLEAVKAIIKFGFEAMNLHTIEAKVSTTNKGVIYLLEKIGFIKEAHFIDKIFFNKTFSDMAVYSLIRRNENYFL